MKKGLVFLAGLILVSTSAVVAQERRPEQRRDRRVEDADLPRWVEDDVIRFFNDPSTIHFSDRSRIPSTRVIDGDVAALGGPFTRAGEIQGDLFVVNGDLVLESGAVVTGDVLVVGGRVLGEGRGDIGGNLRIFEEPLRYVQRGDRIAAARGGRSQSWQYDSDFGWGDARFTVKTGQNYNRIEGLPIMFGPSIRTAGSTPFKLDLLAIGRTEYGLELGEEDFGWALRAEQSVGRREHLNLGGTYYSMVQPMEDWGLTDLEASLATFVLHTDYRDYYERTGWSAYASLDFAYLPVELKAEYFEEDHEFARVSSPWSVTKNTQAWRPQPLVAEGKVRFVEASLSMDTRNRPDDATDGWYIRASGQRGVGGTLAIPEHRSSSEDLADLISAQEYGTKFLAGFLDIRRYNRVSPSSALNLRGVFGGSLNDKPLPPQFQHALGGVGSLPGFDLMSGDCGARDETRGYDVSEGGTGAMNSVFPTYGCDQFALFQVEFRGNLFLDWGLGWGDEGNAWDDDWNWYPNVDFSPDWTAFFNFGRGWSLVEDGVNTGDLADVGVGIHLGDLGVYYAYPLTDEPDGDRNGQFFIRLSRRF